MTDTPCQVQACGFCVDGGCTRRLETLQPNSVKCAGFLPMATPPTSLNSETGAPMQKRETVTIDEIDFEVEFDYQPAEKGMRERSGLQLEPDWPEAIDITAVVYNGRDFFELLDQKTVDLIGENLLEIANEPPDLDYLREDR